VPRRGAAGGPCDAVEFGPNYFFFACFAARFSFSVLVGSFLVFFF